MARLIPRNLDCRGYTIEFLCTNCQCLVFTNYAMQECDYEYCPYCGAKMDGNPSFTTLADDDKQYSGLVTEE